MQTAIPSTRTTKLFTLFLGLALLTGGSTFGAIIQKDDFEGHAVGATLDNTGGDDIAGWSFVAGHSEFDKTNVAIVNNTPDAYTSGQQMNIDPDATNWGFIGTDSSVAAADIQTLAFQSDAQLFSQNDQDGSKTGVLGLNLGVDNTKRYVFLLNADDDALTHELKLQNSNTDIATATPAGYSAFDLHSYELLFTVNADDSHTLKAFLDDTEVLSATLNSGDTNYINFSGNDLVAMYGIGGGRRAVVDNAVFSNIPEPASASLLLLGVAALCARRRRR